jgi:hypothetical protein
MTRFHRPTGRLMPMPLSAAIATTAIGKPQLLA